MRHLGKAILVIAALGLMAQAFAADGAPPAKAPVVAAPAAKAPPAKAPTPSVAPAAPATAPAPVDTAPATKAPERPAGEATATKAEPKVQAWWHALIYDVVFKLVMPIFTLVLSALVFWLLRKMGLKIELDTLDKIALSAAVHGEKKGAEWLRENGEKSGGVKKERWAWELVDMVDNKLQAKTRLKEKLRGLILSKVPEAEKIVNGTSAIRELVAEPKEG